jgi:hypothetical protein
MSTSQTAPAPLVSILANEPRRWSLGSQAWIRIGSEQSGGSLAIAEHLIPPAAERHWPADGIRLARRPGQEIPSGSLGSQTRRSHQERLTRSTSDRP